MTISTKALEAAAKAITARLKAFPFTYSSLSGQVGWGATPEDIAYAALDAALPHIKAQLTAEMAEMNEFKFEGDPNAYSGQEALMSADTYARYVEAWYDTFCRCDESGPCLCMGPKLFRRENG